MHKLSLRFSPQVLTLDGHAYHLFPPPDALPADLEPTLRELGFGYRAGFIESSLASLRVEFGSKVEAELMSWRELPVDQVREKLLALKGVGRKVADCVMLMCLDQVSLEFSVADRSHRSFRSTHMWEPSPLDTLLSHPGCATNQCRNPSTTRFKLFCWTNGDHWVAGVKRSCLPQICPSLSCS